MIARGAGGLPLRPGVTILFSGSAVADGFDLPPAILLHQLEVDVIRPVVLPPRRPKRPPVIHNAEALFLFLIAVPRLNVQQLHIRQRLGLVLFTLCLLYTSPDSWPQVRKPANQGWYPKGDSTKPDGFAS